jgi:DNA-binding transcriptional LysR family regulator
MIMELRQLRYFIALAQDLHFHKAAAKLFIVQPALTRQIKNLEEELGIKLFERNKRNVALTEGGVFFLKEAKNILLQLDTVKENLLDHQQNIKGQLRVGYMGSAIWTILPDFIQCINKKLPGIQLQLTEMSTPQQMQLLLNHELDIGFVREKPDWDFAFCKPVHKEKFVLAISAKYSTINKKAISLKKFSNMDFILPSKEAGDAYSHLIASFFAKADFVPKVSHYCMNAQTILKLVEDGLGVAVLPECYAKYKSRKVKFIQPKELNRTTSLYVVWNKENKKMSLVKCLDVLT